MSVGKRVSESGQLRQFHGAREDDDNPVKLKNGNVYGTPFIPVINPSLHSCTQIVHVIRIDWR